MKPEQEKKLTTPSEDGPQFRPAKGFLVTMGVLILLIGLLVGYVFLKMIDEVSSPDLVYSVMMFILFEFFAICVVLGLGSIGLKKWARDLLLASGWVIIGFGVFTAILTIMGLATNYSQTFSPYGNVPITAIAYFIVSLIFIAPGALLVVIYRTKGVYLTTRYFDQSPSFTEKLTHRQNILWTLLFIGVVYTPTILLLPEILENYQIQMSDMFAFGLMGLNFIILIGLLLGLSKGSDWSWWASVGYGTLLLGISLFMYSYLNVENYVDELTKEWSANEEYLAYLEQSFRTQHKIASTAVALFLMSFAGLLYWTRKDFFPSPELEEIDEEMG